MTSVHDHHVLELTIDAVASEIRLRTGFPHRNGPTFARVRFTNVAAYVFHGDALGTILFDIEEKDPIALYRDHANEMRGVYARTGGHAGWVESESEARRTFSENMLRGYVIGSSIGFRGAVWAGSLSIEFE